MVHTWESDQMITFSKRIKPIEYRVNGYLHRVNGPAYIHGDWWAWRLYSKEHRYYGVQSAIGGWWVNGVHLK